MTPLADDGMYESPKHLSPTGAPCKMARCARRCFYYLCGLRDYPADDPPIYFDFGSAIHAGIPHAGRGDLDVAFEAFDGIWQDREGDEKRNKGRALAMMTDYATSQGGGKGLFQLIEPPQGTAEAPERISDFEVAFALDLGLNLPIVGKIDSISQHRDTGEFWPVEYKTSAVITERYLGNFEGSPQIVTYTIAASFLCDTRCPGVSFQALRVSKSRAETIVMPMYVSDVQMDDMVKWYAEQHARITVCEDVMVWPKNRAMCSGYATFGSPTYQCEYWELCEAEDWRLMKDRYHVHERREFKVLKTATEVREDEAVGGRRGADVDRGGETAQGAE